MRPCPGCSVSTIAPLIATDVVQGGVKPKKKPVVTRRPSTTRLLLHRRKLKPSSRTPMSRHKLKPRPQDTFPRQKPNLKPTRTPEARRMNPMPMMQANVGPTSPPCRGVSERAPVGEDLSGS